MIQLDKYSLALNAVKVPGPDYRMDETVKMSKTTTAHDVISHILTAVGNTSDLQIKNLVINCHGSPGVIYLGETECIKDGKTVKKPTYIGIQHVGLFNLVKGYIGTIWITGCQVGSGANFCSQLAVTARCSVVAADVLQYINPGYYLRLFPKNCIDEFEGTAYKWDEKGNKSVFSRREWYAL
jgi:hypothetical protein